MTFFKARLSRAQTVTPAAGGMIDKAKVKVRFNKSFSKATVNLNISGDANVFAAHFHCGAPGVEGDVAVDILLNFDGDETYSGTITNDDIIAGDCTLITNLVTLAHEMRIGEVYANIHTDENPSGEMRGQLIEFED